MKYVKGQGLSELESVVRQARSIIKETETQILSASSDEVAQQHLNSGYERLKDLIGIARTRFHVLLHGQALCGRPGVPATWDVEESWVRIEQLKVASAKHPSEMCEECLAQVPNP